MLNIVDLPVIAMYPANEIFVFWRVLNDRNYFLQYSRVPVGDRIIGFREQSFYHCSLSKNENHLATLLVFILGYKMYFLKEESVENLLNHNNNTQKKTLFP